MNENNRNAISGRNIEILFKNTIKDHLNVIENIKKYFNISGDLDSSMQTGIYGEKVDVKIGFNCGHTIDANVKSYKAKTSGANQLARASVDRFCEIFNIDEENKDKLKNIVLNKAKNKDNFLFPEKEIEYWKSVFIPLKDKIIKWGFSKNKSREILVLYCKEDEVFYIYPMKEVLKNISKDIKFTKGGFDIGDYVSFQRKGGNGKSSTKYKKTDIKHPGNNFQLKIKCYKFVNGMENYLLDKYKASNNE